MSEADLLTQSAAKLKKDIHTELEAISHTPNSSVFRELYCLNESGLCYRLG